MRVKHLLRQLPELYKRQWLSKAYYQNPLTNPRMPEKKQAQNSKGEVKWWVWLVVGVMLLIVPGGVFASPVFFIISAIMKARNKPRGKTSPSLILLINTQP